MEKKDDFVETIVALTPSASTTELIPASHENDYDQGLSEKGILEMEMANAAAHHETNLIDVEKLPTYYTAIRVVPLVAMFALSSGIAGPTFTELMKSRVCEEGLHIPHNICQHLDSHNNSHSLQSVTKMTSYYRQIDTLIEAIPAAIFSLFAGSWSDKHGRKLPMLLPFLGMFLAYAYILMCAYLPLPPAYLLVASVLRSLSGGHVIAMMAIFSYIGDYTTDATRSPNIALIDGCEFIVRNGGTVLGGYLMQNYGQPVPYYVVCAVYAVAFVYVLVVIRDRRQLPARTGFRGCTLGEIMSPERIKDNWRTLTKPRPGRHRLIINLILGCNCITAICVIGDVIQTQLYLEGYPFNWTLQFYTIFSAIHGVVESAVLVLTTIVLHRYFHIPDTMLAIIAITSSVVNLIGYGASVVSWMIYVFAALGTFRLISIVCIRSLLISLVGRDEMGKILSVMTSVFSLAPLLGNVIFSSIFRATLDWWPGFCFVLGGACMSPVLGVFVYIHIIRQRELNGQKCLEEKIESNVVDNTIKNVTTKFE